MARILGIGVATCDVVLTVGTYPQEDDKVRAAHRHIMRGGNAANTLVVLGQLGHRCAWAGVTTSDSDGRWILEELGRSGVDTSPSAVVTGGSVPTSYVLLSRTRGTRTIVHYRDLREYAFEEFVQLDLTDYDWLHFEGRNVSDTRQMLEHARTTVPHITRSLEVEKARDDIETLCPLADVLLYSGAYARERGHSDPPAFLRSLADSGLHGDLVCTWGDDGAYALNADQDVVHSPAFPPSSVVDARGAGDTFNAGFIDARARGLGLGDSVRAGCRLAGRKCGIFGLEITQATTDEGN